MGEIADRVLARMGDEQLIERLLALPKSDLNSLLLKLFQEQAGKTAPVDVLKAHHGNRFSAPSGLDPVAYHILEAEVLALAQKRGMSAVLLSPSAPFASCAAFGCVDQNNVVSAVRGTEILSDPTNMLAILLAEQIKRGKLDGRGSAHYCATARVLRAQAFPPIEGLYPHFGVFCLVSVCRDSGSYGGERDLLMTQLSYYKELLHEKYHARLTVVLRKRGGYVDGDGFFDRMADLVRAELPDVPISFDLDHVDNHYYRGINFKIYMEREGGSVEIGDGGFVDWIQRMTGNRKQRCLISGIGLDRLLTVL